MGSDCYCCFCGALAGRPTWDEDSDDEEYSYDPAVLQTKDTDWMDEVRLIGRNPYSLGVNKTFITGPARYEDYQSFDVDRSEDPNFPTSEQMNDDNNNRETVSFRAYCTDEGFPLTIPFHLSCFNDIFPKVVRYSSGTANELDLEQLYGALASLCSEDIFSCLTIDYGEISDSQDQYWCTTRGQEAFVTDPHRIEALLHYYERMLRDIPQKASPVKPLEIEQTRQQGSRDPFSTLPPELLLNILLLLPMKSVNSMRAASNATRSLHLSNAFWRSRVLNDMPWLYDLPLDKLDQLGGQVDWANIYNDVLRMSEASSSTKINGLYNRRRIWGLCDQIANVYVARLRRFVTANRDSDAETLEGATSSFMPKLLKTSSADFTSFRLPAVKHWHQFLRTKLGVSSEWNEAGILTNLKISAYSEDEDPEESPPSVRNQIATIDKGDWISGLILTLQEGNKGGCDGICGFEILTLRSSDAIGLGNLEGNKRLLHTSSGKFFVGLQGETTKGVISGLSLLETPLPDDINNDLNGLLGALSKSPYEDAPISRYMWKDSLPPPHISTSTFDAGYWDYDFSVDTNAVEHLVFGKDEQDFKAITGVAGDMHLRAFRVDYSDRPAKKIGQLHTAMSLFPIDGASGERVVRMRVYTPHIPKCLVLGTNWGRIAVFGHQDHGQGTWEDMPPGKTFVGIGGIWNKGSEHRLAAAAMLLAPVSSAESSNLERDSFDGPAEDSDGRLWEPGRPPLNWEEAGTIHGNNSRSDERIPTGGNHHLPTDAHAISWLDCTKPITKIEAWFTHPSTFRLSTQLISLVFRYGDGSSAAVGPQEVETTAIWDTYPCQCKQYTLGFPSKQSNSLVGGGLLLLGGAPAGDEEGNQSGEDANMNEEENPDDDDDVIDEEEAAGDGDDDMDEEDDLGIHNDDMESTNEDDGSSEKRDEDLDGGNSEEEPDDGEYTTPEWPYPRAHFFPGESFALSSDGERLRSLRIWSSDFLDGLQFVSETGLEGPKWGTCDGQPTGLIMFDVESSKEALQDDIDDSRVTKDAVGLKLFLGPNTRPVTFDEVIIFGCQALVQSSTQ